MLQKRYYSTTAVTITLWRLIRSVFVRYSLLVYTGHSIRKTVHSVCSSTHTSKLLLLLHSSQYDEKDRDVPRNRNNATLCARPLPQHRQRAGYMACLHVAPLVRDTAITHRRCSWHLSLQLIRDGYTTAHYGTVPLRTVLVLLLLLVVVVLILTRRYNTICDARIICFLPSRCFL